MTPSQPPQGGHLHMSPRKNVGNVECPPGIWITVKSLFSAAPILWANFRRQMTMDAFVGGGISLDPREISYGTQLNSGSTIEWLRPRTRARPPLWESRPCCPSAVNVIHTHASGLRSMVWWVCDNLIPRSQAMIIHYIWLGHKNTEYNYHNLRIHQTLK